MYTKPSRGVLSSASDDDGGGSQARCASRAIDCQGLPKSVTSQTLSWTESLITSMPTSA
jgi:hypothetical protein